MKQSEEVRGAIEAILCRTPGVIGASYFGSIAAAECDSLSDIDLVVGCAGRSANLVITALHAELEIVLFRPFSEDRQPGGRYWFKTVNPFLRLDVSFYPGPEFSDLLLHGRGFAQPPFRRINLDQLGNSIPPQAPVPEWTQLDHDFAGALRQFHDSAKKVGRGETPKYPLREAEFEVRGFRAQGLRPEAWKLFEASGEHLRGSA